MTRLKAMIRMSTRQHGWLHWLSNGCWAVAEHGVFAAGNFLMNVVLIRWLTPHDYGAFTAVFTTFLFISSLHTGLVVEPVLVFGPGDYRDRRGAYLRGVLKGHWVISAAEGAILLLVGVVCLLRGDRALGATFLAMAIAQAFIQLLWLMRQACYFYGAAEVAAAASVGYLALMVAGLWTVHAADGGTVSCLTAVAVSSLLAALWIGRQLGGFDSGPDSASLWHGITRQHWRYGRWGVAGSVFGSAPAILCYLVFPLYASLSQSGALRAMSVIVMPGHLATTAMSRLLLPQLVRRRGTRSFWRVAGVGAITLTLGCLLYWLALGLEHRAVIHLIYGGRFVEESSLLWLVGSMPLIGGLATVATVILSAYEKPSLVFYGNAIPGVLTMVFGTVLCIYGGIWGAAWANVLNSVWNVACLGVFVLWTFAGGGAGRLAHESVPESRSREHPAVSAKER